MHKETKKAIAEIHAAVYSSDTFDCNDENSCEDTEEFLDSCRKWVVIAEKNLKNKRK